MSTMINGIDKSNNLCFVGQNIFFFKFVSSIMFQTQNESVKWLSV
jgi:hypothetical protein